MGGLLSFRFFTLDPSNGVVVWFKISLRNKFVSKIISLWWRLSSDWFSSCKCLTSFFKVSTRWTSSWFWNFNWLFRLCNFVLTHCFLKIIKCNISCIISDLVGFFFVMFFSISLYRSPITLSIFRWLKFYL